MNELVGAGAAAAEAAGGLATGALVAREFDHAQAPAPPPEETLDHGRCLNCAASAPGRFCAACGQPTHLHRSLGHMAHEFLHGLLHFDGRAWRTLPMLAWRPGELTRDYVFGKRQRYIAPLTLFLLTIFVMFFAFGLSGGHSVTLADAGPVRMNDGTPIPSPEAIATVAQADAAIARLDAEITATAADPKRSADLAPLRIIRSAYVGRRDALAAAAAGRPAEAAEAPWATVMRGAVERGDIKIHMPTPGLTARVRHALLNPELTAYKMLQKGYKLSFLLVPLSLPWMLLLFARRRGVRAYDHTVFLLYSQSFMAMLVIVGVLLSRAGVTWGGVYALLLLLPLPHLYRQLRGAYLLTRFGAAWRTAALTAAALLTLGVYTAFILALGLLD